MDKDIGELAKKFLLLLDLDPRNGYLNRLLGQVTDLTPQDFKKIGIGTFIYAGLYVVEGVGLIMAKRWAEYLTIIITASLLPLEGYEVIMRAGPIRITALVVNLIIVIYLIWQLRRGNRGPI
jgi:uncharacterized membrane protein (DUF2068 family)